MATTVQFLNVDVKPVRLTTTNRAITTVPAVFTARGSVAVNAGGTSVDLAALDREGRRELQRALASGKLLVFPTGTIASV